MLAFQSIEIKLICMNYLCLYQGLKEKSLTWEYLFSDNFMHQAVNSTVPVDKMLIFLDVAMHMQVKPRLGAMLENATEHFWRTKGLPGQGDYEPRVRDMLRRHDITLPFKFSGDFSAL